ncbi:MAG: S-ribosylhomocysteine lyase [Defluviitaleaceae bacterium]|nr:S-ribosylhomocysteine lyase [Defluviitaleaceae bacterium]
MDVTSFKIDHDRLQRGVYVSRKDYVGDHCITTFDVRMKLCNTEPPMEISAVHSVEHLLAVYMRSEESGVADELIYIGPMGCRTGMYMIMKGDLSPEDVLDLLRRAYKSVLDFEGVVPYTTSDTCGNCNEHNLTLAKWEARIYYDEVLMNMKPENMTYPQ